MARLVNRDAWVAQPWKNGRGVTHEIWRWTDPKSAPAGGFDLRLSVARIEGVQEFSAFPGYWRALVPLDDSDLTLGAGLPLVKHQVFEFPGDVPMGTRGAGTTRDLNVMSRLARSRALVEISTSETHPDSHIAHHLAVFALTRVSLRDGHRERTLDALDTWIQVDDGGDATFTASEPVVWIRF